MRNELELTLISIWMTSIHNCLLLVSSLVIHSGCLNSSTMASTNNQMEGDIMDGSADGSLNITIYTNSDNSMKIDDLKTVNNTGRKVRIEVIPLRKRLRTRKNDAECRKYSLREKYKMLEALGGRNQRYLAETPEEASRSFVSSASSPLLMKYADVPQEDKYTPYCNKECETIRIRLENALEKRQPKRRLWAAAPFSLAQHDDVGHVEIERDFSSMGKCSLETFIPLKNCTDRSNEVASQGYELCSMCQGAYLLSENCFPSFINSVLCDKREIGCIFDFSDRPHGTCREEPLTLPVLRNHGSSECEDWIPYEIQIPVACQCILSAHSWLHSTPPKKL